MQVISDDNQNDIEIKNFLICIAMRSDEFTKEVLTTFFKDEFYFDKKVKESNKTYITYL